MEASKEGEDLTPLDKILPPRLEDAGLENCALPPHSIYEAFLKAASAVGCVTEVSPLSDMPAGNHNQPDTAPSGPCAAVKGGDAVDAGEMKMNRKEASS